ncbi:hypothetical protein TNIN_180181 [Trichonephila inaurata madagascariensis]|uniref:Uncharacterized protein n=1 Tax=Trichonephila inaurata madagascariensis TaxID=2747483 RepID=A0A8X6WT69_9ARAC|nr:hypothetical protein TNIN_180181 [Trichonephila inaurata madagascariensis]
MNRRNHGSGRRTIRNLEPFGVRWAQCHPPQDPAAPKSGGEVPLEGRSLGALGVKFFGGVIPEGGLSNYAHFKFKAKHWGLKTPYPFGPREVLDQKRLISYYYETKAEFEI